MADPARPARPADAASGDGLPDPAPPRPAAPPSTAAAVHAGDETMDMSQVAGDRLTALPELEGEPAGGKKKKKPKAMTEVGPTTGSVSKADQALLELGTKRGIETLFRTNYRTNMDLTSLADAKANIMISINGLIVSILIASLAPGFEKNPWLLFATSLFLVGCLVSLVFAVLAARPRVQETTVTVESALENRLNLLFFGNFHHLTRDEYVYAMKQVVQDPTQIYEMMMKDVYGIGSVLQKKYVLLRTSYTVFIVALVVGVLSFIGTFAYTTYIEPRAVTTTTYEAPVPTPGGVLPGARPGAADVFP